MKNKIKLLSASVALGASLMMGNASAITVAGVTWDENDSFDFSSQQSLFENNVSGPGDTLTFYGIINEINGRRGFCTGCRELTFVGTYNVVEAGDFDGDGRVNVLFDSGILNVYSDVNSNFNRDDSSTANDGTLFASLSGHTQTISIGGVDKTGDLFAELDSGLVLGGSNDAGFGAGAWDIIGGAAKLFLDTNTRVDGSDFTYTTSFQPVTPDDSGTSLFGTAELKGDSQAVPEPSILALLGIGLLGFGTTRRKSVS
ncbi:MAG: PEP-CTERM sorting domain-containing protein [Methylococcaceae bacterium]